MKFFVHHSRHDSHYYAAAHIADVVDNIFDYDGPFRDPDDARWHIEKHTHEIEASRIPSGALVALLDGPEAKMWTMTRNQAA
jgi:hypothetical protein